ncbi:hypothetical protein ACOXVJ_07010 [Pseudomonas knackmussii]|uniref:hypothetical protein n=1 Tax=Pseudomonas knackmussii TaxID=65741 RepID=UPI003BEDD6BC
MNQKNESSNKQAHRLRRLWLALTWLSIALAVLGALLPGVVSMIVTIIAGAVVSWSRPERSPASGFPLTKMLDD